MAARRRIVHQNMHETSFGIKNVSVCPLAGTHHGLAEEDGANKARADRTVSGLAARGAASPTRLHLILGFTKFSIAYSKIPIRGPTRFSK